MAMGLYDLAFATLACLYGRAARGPITGIRVSQFNERWRTWEGSMARSQR
jgi:hypothetical protein